ncbi:MAG: hypothetical protein P8R54_02470 [Myxococcota bacterium]|nr:hypothetical protein [Myxococcota bacterium]
MHTPRLHQLNRRSDRRGYVMLVAMVLLALLAVLGSSTLTIAGVDQRIALQNRKHMLVLNTSSAGNEHARDELRWTNPLSEGIDSGDTHDDFVNAAAAEADFGGLTYTHNLGVYWVSATYIRCGNPPPGYSTEVGRAGFRSDYWLMESTARMQDAVTNDNINETQAKTASVLRKVMDGSCRIR